MATLLREVRRRRGWTQARLQHELRQAADRLNLTLPTSQESLRVMISGWEVGRHVPRDHHVLLLQEAYGLPADALGFGDPQKPLAEEDAAVRSLIRRRSTELTPELADHFGRQLEEQARMDNLVGPTLVVDTVLGQLGKLEVLEGPDAGRLAARFAEFAGWLLHDSGDSRRALALTEKSVDLADSSGDRSLVVYNLMRKSNVLSSLGEHHRAAGVAERAAVMAREYAPDQLPVCLRQVALCEARLGREGRSRSALDDALHLTAPSLGDDEFSSYCTTSYVEMEAALCALTLGKPAEAVSACERALAFWPQELVRDEGLCRARLAVAHLQLRQVDEASEAVHAALDRVRSAPSARALHMLQVAATKLEPFRQDRNVRELLRLMAEVA